MDLKSTWDSKMHYNVFTTTINDNCGIHDFYPVLPMGKTYPFTHFHPVLPNRFYPVGKTYHANPVYNKCPLLTFKRTVMLDKYMAQLIVVVTDTNRHLSTVHSADIPRPSQSH